MQCAVPVSSVSAQSICLLDTKNKRKYETHTRTLHTPKAQSRERAKGPAQAPATHNGTHTPTHPTTKVLVEAKGKYEITVYGDHAPDERCVEPLPAEVAR